METPKERTTRAQRREEARIEHGRRHQIALELAWQHDGVVSRKMLAAAGLSRSQVRAEVERGVWHIAGWHTLSITSPEPTGRGLWWRALWESGARSVLDGVTSLQAAGLTGWTEESLHLSVPFAATVRPLEGVQHHHLRAIGAVAGGDLRRTRPEVAAIRAAQWAATDRQAALLVAMTVQQRLVAPASVIERWGEIRHTNRRPLLTAVIADVCDGAHSMAELDFAGMCRTRGLPEPTRQAVRIGAKGRVYLDVLWEELGVHVEIQGVHHYQGDNVIQDALRFNEIALGEPVTSLQIPVLGLRARPDAFLEQVERAIREKQVVVSPDPSSKGASGSGAMARIPDAPFGGGDGEYPDPTRS